MIQSTDRQIASHKIAVAYSNRNGVVYFGDTDYLFEENADNLEYMKKENLSDKSEWILIN